MAVDPLPPLKESSSRFREDDLEFRTLTTILSLLNSHDEQEPDSNSLTPRMQRHLKLLASVSAMLVMNHEVIAIMPKRSATGLTLFIGLEPGSDPDINVDDESEDANETLSALHLVTKNPRDNESTTCLVSLMKIPFVNIGSDIFEFIVKNWKQSFEAHAQVIAQLISACYSGNDAEWLRLAHYSLFQSSSKAARRFNTDIFFELLTTLPPADPDVIALDEFPGLTEMDKVHVQGLFEDDDDLAERFPLLEQFVESDELRVPADLGPFLREFYEYFVFLLSESKQQVENLALHRKEDTPPSAGTLRTQVGRANDVIGDLHYFVWSSDFFAWYISRRQRMAISFRYIELSKRPSPSPTPKLEREVGVDERDDCEDEAMPNRNSTSTVEVGQVEDDEGETGDFPTEFETNEDLIKSLHPQHGPAYKCYNWLRLVTSNTHHAARFKRNSPDIATKLDFQVIKYPMSDRIMKPWEETIAEIAGDRGLEKKMIDALRAKADGNKKFRPFLPNGPGLKFLGRAHCEAVLACLHSLAKRSQNIDWAGVPQEVMDLLKTTYSIIALSKRCCPVCATLIALLSREDGAPTLQTLTKHNFIFPTALPFGLPESIRQQLIVEYKQRLRKALDAIVLVRSSSGLSIQSQPLSAGSSDEVDPATRLAQAKRNNTKRWLTGWLRGYEPRRKEKWDRLQTRQPEKWAICRTEVRSQGRLWDGYIVPEYVFREEEVVA